MGVLVVPGVGSESGRRVVWLSVHAALARVPAKMAQDRADSDGFPANAAAAVVGGPARVNVWEPRQGSGRGERWLWAWSWLWRNSVLPEV